MMYQTILMDPPWNETGGGKIKRGADRHYPLVKTPDLPRVIMQSPEWKPADDCHLYMWATNTHLADAIWLMGALGFKYKTNVVWTKEGRKGLGQYFRMQHELLLFGVRGKGYNVKTDDKTIGSWIHAPRGKHSQKPREFYNLIEARSEGPYLEMFARNTPGKTQSLINRLNDWTYWGNEVEQPEAVEQRVKDIINESRPHVYRQMHHGRHEQDRADAAEWMKRWVSEVTTTPPVSTMIVKAQNKWSQR